MTLRETESLHKSNIMKETEKVVTQFPTKKPQAQMVSEKNCKHPMILETIPKT